MPQQVVIQSDGQLKVIEVGPQGPPGKPGVRGPAGPAGDSTFIRRGLEILTAVPETIESVDYLVYEFGSSMKAVYVAPIGGTTPIVIRIDYEADSALAVPFKLSMPLMDFGVIPEIYLDLGVLGLMPYRFWTSFDNGSITLLFSCIPGEITGLPATYWYPSGDTQSTPNSGAYFVTASVEAGDGITTPDCSVSLKTFLLNKASVTVGVDTFAFLEIIYDYEFDSKPIRLELTDAADITTVKVTNSLTSTSFTFDPVALSLVVGTSIICTLQVVNKGTGLEVVLDPIY